MQLTFDPSFDTGHFPGPLHEKDAVCGEAWVGPMGLIGLLEIALGLGGLYESDDVRAASIVPAISGMDGVFFTKSAERNVFQTARTLLRWRDMLWLCGWRGEGKHPTLSALSKACAAVPPGMPDRLVAILGALDKQQIDIETVRVIVDEPGDWRSALSHLPLMWLRLFESMSAVGMTIEALPIENLKATGDLGLAQETASGTIGNRPATGDETLLLLRPSGPMQAAEEVAAYFSALKDAGRTVIIQPSPLLDLAFRRFGLPTTGASKASDNPLLDVLPLVFDMMWDPPDPSRAMALLSIPGGPVPTTMAWWLRRALQDWPAVASSTWDENLERGLNKIDDEKRRERLADRLSTVFSMTMNRQKLQTTETPYPVSDLTSLASAIENWALARASLTDDEHSESYFTVVSQCRIVRNVLETCGREYLSEVELQDICASATASAVGSKGEKQEVGWHVVQSPAAVTAPVERVIWWNFNQDTISTPPVIPFENEIIDELASFGVHLPQPQAIALAQARRWKRPLLAAQKQLILVCPRAGEDGEENHPHPLWDELSNMKEHHKLIRANLPANAKTTLPEHLPTPQACRYWETAKGYISAPETWSPSSLGTLVSCPFKWVLSKTAGIENGSLSTLPNDSATKGSLTHEVLERVLEAGPLEPKAAARLAAKVFNEIGPRRMARLWLDGNEQEKARTERDLSKAVEFLLKLLSRNKLKVVATEKELTGTAGDFPLRGYADLIVGDPLTIIDHKWQSGSYYQRMLDGGSAYQLATYSYMQKEGDRMPGVAYFIVSERRLLVPQSVDLEGAEVQASSPPQESVWQAFRETYERVWQSVRDGEIVATGVPGEDGETSPSSNRFTGESLTLAPSCRFCDYGWLCGLEYGE